jgi:flagellar M-ring protein FliF
MGALAEGLKALGPARLFAMAAVAFCVAGFLAVLISRGGSPTMALLYGDLDLREAAQMAEQLDAQHIPHSVTPAGNAILVAETDVGRARLLLARQGLPSGGSVGYELFDKADGLTTTQFQQQIIQLRALEGELARTIRGIAGVRAVRVHLVLPRREPFERDRQEAQASILLSMAGGARLDPEGVQAVLNLVAAAVPGLRAHNIAIVDSRGDVLARAGETVGPGAAAQTLEDVQHGIETRLARAVEDMLEPSLGPGRVRAEAAVDLDTGQVHETKESFDPDGKVERSTQTMTDSSKTTEAPPTVSVQNNLPNADATPQGAGSQQQRQEETTNYEIGKTVRTLVREQPEVRRISLAVLVDGTEGLGPDGKPTYVPRSREELDHIGDLVRGAIGYDAKRGDKVEIVNLRFTPPEEPPAPVARRLFGFEISDPDLIRLGQTALVGVLALLGILLVLRPMVLRLSLAGGAAMALAGGSAGALPGAAGPALLGSEAMGAGGDPSGGGPPGAMMAAAARATGADGQPMLALTHDGARGAAGEDDAMVDVLNIEGQMRASSMRRIAEMVEQHPEQSLAIIRGWMQQEQA